MSAASAVIGLQNMSPVDLFVAFGIEVGQDQVPLIVANDRLRPLGNEEGIGAVGLLAAGGGVTFPEQFPGLRIQTADFAIGADTIDTAVLE